MKNREGFRCPLLEVAGMGWLSRSETACGTGVESSPGFVWLLLRWKQGRQLEGLVLKDQPWPFWADG